MADNGRVPTTHSASDHVTRRRMTLRSYREQAPDSDLSDSEAPANTAPPASTARSSLTLFGPSTSEQARASTTPTPVGDLSPRGRLSRRFPLTRTFRRGGRDSAVGSPSRTDAGTAPGLRGNGPIFNTLHASAYENELAAALEQDLFYDDLTRNDPTASASLWNSSQGRGPDARRSTGISTVDSDWELEDALAEERVARRQLPSTLNRRPDSLAHDRPMAGSSKRSRDKFESTDSNSMSRILSDRGAHAIMLYRSAGPDPEANDIWPKFRSAVKLPVRYCLLNQDSQSFPGSKTKRRLPNIGRKRAGKDKQADIDEESPAGRPKWNLPVELVEVIADYLTRDDIKSLRLVSHELNHYISQVIFQTVVVPFNTEIYGMLGHGQKPDLKGKKRAKHEKPGYSWKNSNGDEVYNGHGLDVFKGFGRHILRYGMSFEVNEESLSQPPAKSLTEEKMSFWGNYDWPFEEYRRFDTVAGLETAADETPRMKIAFAELTRIKELALSLNSGLGWLNGPDRSIRARILQQPPAVFGSRKNISDRRAQAQQELWRHIESRHEAEGEDVKLATLYRLDGARPLSEAEENCMLADEQPELPYIDAYVIHGATPNDTAEVPLPRSLDDPPIIDRTGLDSSGPGTSTGILFSSVSPPSDAAQVVNPIIPVDLTKAQGEWLLETEWAQRAFMSSYMLSIIDNPTTFSPVHTLTISMLSDRYLSLLNRPDFWAALPNLTNLTLMVIPGWRTVHKDEAGFVDTPRINPINGFDTFCNLLHNQVANLPGLKSLTIGWVGGGEHAEGVHARNKLLMPAPVMLPGVCVDAMTELNTDLLRAALLQFPYISRLKLKNCWITPGALLQLVRIHDEKHLQHLVLDSVSMTAVLRPIEHNQIVPVGNVPNALAAAPAVGLGGFVNVPNININNNNNNATSTAGNQTQAQPAPNVNQLLQTIATSLQVQLQHLQQMQVNAGVMQQQHIATLRAQLQNQMQNLHAQVQQQTQIQQHQQQVQQHQQTPTPVPAQAQHQGTQNLQIQNQMTASLHAVTTLAAQVQIIHQQIAANVPAQATYQPPTDPQSLLRDAPRDGSWMSVIDVISPGLNLSDFGSEHSKADAARETALQSIEFVSCGYAKLPHATYDQTGVDRGNRLALSLSNSTFSKRYSALAPAMMSAKWTHLGEIVQDVDAAELAGLDIGWNLKTGWDDAEEARAVEFDGLFRGGTGRFTGKVQVSDRVADAGGAGGASFDAVLEVLRELGVGR